MKKNPANVLSLNLDWWGFDFMETSYTIRIGNSTHGIFKSAIHASMYAMEYYEVHGICWDWEQIGS